MNRLSYAAEYREAIGQKIESGRRKRLDVLDPLAA